jgi:hypothetical protein
MIARKITYKGNFNQEALNIIYDLTRKTEITGQVKMVSDREIVLNLEGDPAFIKLLQHRIDRSAKSYISEKLVEPIPYQRYVGVTLLT